VRKNHLFIFILSLLVLLPQAHATLQIPGQLTKSDENKILQILGYGSSAKILGDPYPLGGYSGLEVGYSAEILQTDQLAALGSAATMQSQLSYNMITIGKGLYNNIDTFLTFALMGQQENITNVGGQIRWGFFQASYLPIYLSAVLHGNSFNCENTVVTNTVGLDIIAGFKEGDVTLYFGGGTIRVQGTFTGGNGGITSDGGNDSASIAGSRFLAGLNVKFFGKAFFAGEIDNYANAVYSAKLGYRF
jgi:hypothetical protein